MSEEKNKPKTETINGKVFEVPENEVLCVKCGTTNYYYDDNTPPFRCDKCGKILVNLYPDPPIRGDPCEWA